MSPIAAKYLQVLLDLPESERAELATRLIDSLDPDHDAGVEDAWSTEILRRNADLDSGVVKPVPWPDVLCRLRRA
jgi:putative addiction module component (TIGR02574 family)